MALRVDCKRQGADHNTLSFADDLPRDLMDGRHMNVPSDRRKVVKPERSDSAFIFSTLDTSPDGQEDMAAHHYEQLPFNMDGRRSNIIYPARFQPILINLPSVHESLGLYSQSLATQDGQSNEVILSKAIAISAIPSSPPGIVLSFQRRAKTANASSPHLVVVNHTLCGPIKSSREPGDGSTSFAGKSMSLSTFVRPGHRLPLDAGADDESLTSSSAVSPNGEDRLIQSIWCTGGQGWSLLGIEGTGTKFFICWEGATDDSNGPFILQLQSEQKDSFCLASGVMPFTGYIKCTEKLTPSSHRTVDTKVHSSQTYSLKSFLPQDDTGDGFHTGYSTKRSFSIILKESIKMTADIEGGLDDIIVSALDSISTPHHQSPEARAKSMIAGGRSSRSKMLTMSHREKSKRLLRQCTSWTQLDDSKANNGVVHGQVLVATVRGFGTQFQSLTLRTSVIANPISTPFHQVLSWLCQRRDFYTAASVALSLLDDAEAVYDLCGIPKSPEEEFTHHKGLLDGIKPLDDDSYHNGDNTDIMISLADMAIGCLIKGGTSMSKPLEGFLVRNTVYNAHRACIMLVGATASVLGNEPTSQKKMRKIENVIDMLPSVESPSEEQIWPVRCLIKMAVVRKCLPSAMLMLNATIPNELRWRAPKSRGLSSAPRPSLGLFLALADLILESTEEATRYLLNMMDEETGLPYWFSIGEDTKLALSLISIRGKHIMLQEPEVREWALGRLKEEIESPTDACNMESAGLHDGWLKEVVTGAFCNAGCDIGLGLDTTLTSNSTPPPESEFVCYRQDMLRIRDSLVPQQQSGGLDFDLLIAALLVLARRGHGWRSRIPTMALLNCVCDMAGRPTDFEPKFVFDGATVMRQCALTDNLQAAAFLVGGKQGLVLECADIVVSNLSMTVKDAEIALFRGSLSDLRGTVMHIYEGVNLKEESLIFTPDASHQHLTWLLEEHVLNVHTYGEFDSPSRTGKITPVFAGRVLFRAWCCLTDPCILSSSANWLEGWLRRKLELWNGKSPRRLACAALVRILLWGDETEDLDLSDRGDEPLLAVVMGFDGRFMAELAQACCGLIQSIPPHLAEELMSSFGGSNLYSFEASFIDSAQ